MTTVIVCGAKEKPWDPNPVPTLTVATPCAGVPQAGFLLAEVVLELEVELVVEDVVVWVEELEEVVEDDVGGAEELDDEVEEELEEDGVVDEVGPWDDPR